MSEQPTAVERKEAAYQTVRDFWETYGDVLQQENGPGTFKHALVQKMKQVYEDIVAGSDGAMIHRKILDILGEQSMSMIQFESCLDWRGGSDFLWGLHVLWCDRPLFNTVD